MKHTYVALAHGLRALLAVTGLLGLLDRWATGSRTGLWARSLFAIHDLEDLVAHDVPWWTFEASDQVETFLRGRPGARVFEWGSGASTVWLSRRAGSVTSIEHDPAWAERVRPVLGENATVRVVAAGPGTSGNGATLSRKPGFEGLDFSAYAASLGSEEGQFDLIVIDGRAREACFREAVRRVAPGGLLVFDNVDRRRYRAALAGAPVPLDVQWTRGLTPALPYPTRTALVRVRG
jgi:SAM-dependent methyltransferase